MIESDRSAVLPASRLASWPGRRLRAIEPIPLAIGIFCALEALFLFLLPNFGFTGSPSTLPLAFENFWFQRQSWLSLQEILMWGHVLLAVALWLSYRLRGASERVGRVTRLAAYIGAGLLLVSVHLACRALSMAVPRVILTRIYP